MKNRSGTLFGFILLAAYGAVHCCTHGWYRYGNRCFRIHTEAMTHLSGRRLCHSEGSDLASISDQSILRYISMQLATVRGDRFWVGIVKDLEADIFVWLDGTNATQPWVQPGSVTAGQFYMPDSQGIEQYCFAYNRAEVLPEKCYERLPFICERNDSVIPDTRNRCERISQPSFVGPVTGNCIFVAAEQVEFSESPHECSKEFGAQVLSLDGVMRDSVLGFLANRSDTTVKYWTTLTWNDTNVLFPSGSVLKDDNLSVERGSGFCVTFQPNAMTIVQLFQTECSGKAAVICYSDIESLYTTTVSALSDIRRDDSGGECPSGYHWKFSPSTNYCYWETSFETDFLTWSEAEDYCKENGGHLASFHSVQEEIIGLSFQYGSLSHSYWIGLKYNISNDTYYWSDGSPVDYENWAVGHPDHRDKQLQCVSMEAREKHWISSLCEIPSWFICKVPKTPNPVSPVLPTRTPLLDCGDGSYYFNGYCYYPKPTKKLWFSAQRYCQDMGASLVSIHSVQEIGFLLKLLHSSSEMDQDIWIGMSHSSSNEFVWDDRSPVDFTYFKEKNPASRYAVRCFSMNSVNGFWEERSCSVELEFICKRQNNSLSTLPPPTTQDPSLGNCRKGWIEHHDRCYLLGGTREKDRVTYTEAANICRENGGYLTTIRNERDQAFLSYLLQLIKIDTWIGLHDEISSGTYSWVDNTGLSYTNWAPGEPSFFGLQEDCVLMKYKSLDSGLWKDAGCHERVAYICMRAKEFNISDPSENKALQCLQPAGWLKLENMCFKMFVDENQRWYNAEANCRKEGGHLASISNMGVKAITSYLATEANMPFWIGLVYQEPTQTFHWLNDWPFTISKWGRHEPIQVTHDSCFESTPKGYWSTSDCFNKKAYICQITSGHAEQEKHYEGGCSDHPGKWIAGTGDNCYLVESGREKDWTDASLLCLINYGTHLVSIHSLEELRNIKEIVDPKVRSIFLGLYSSTKTGLLWTDDTPVNFINWDVGQPETRDESCVEMKMDTLKWRVISCSAKRNFVCQAKKDTLVVHVPVKPKKEAYSDESQGMSKAGIAVTVVCSLLGIIAVLAVYLYCRTRSGHFPQARRFSNQDVSFENALYNVDRANMEFQEDTKNEHM